MGMMSKLRNFFYLDDEEDFEEDNKEDEESKEHEDEEDEDEEMKSIWKVYQKYDTLLNIFISKINWSNCIIMTNWLSISVDWFSIVTKWKKLSYIFTSELSSLDCLHIDSSNHYFWNNLSVWILELL